MKLYKEFGVNPLAGCLPIIIQLPLIYALYQVLQDVVKYNIPKSIITLYSFIPKLTKIWDLTFFGLPLAQNPSHLISTMGPINSFYSDCDGSFAVYSNQNDVYLQPKPLGRS